MAFKDLYLKAKKDEQQGQERVSAETIRNDAVERGVWTDRPTAATPVPKPYKPSKDVSIPMPTNPVKATAEVRQEKVAVKAGPNIRGLAEEAQRAYDNYLHSSEYRQKTIEREKKKAWNRVLVGAVGADPVPEEVDEKEQQLKAAAEYWKAKADAEENQRTMDADLEELDSLSEEDRETLKIYAVDRDRDALSDPWGAQLPKTEDQKRADALIAKYGKQKVDELAESFMRSQNREAAQIVTEAAQESAGDGFVKGAAHSLATVPVGLAGGLTGVLGYLQEMKNNTGRYSGLDPNNAGTLLNTYSGAVRGEVAQNIEEGNGVLGKAGSIAYQGVMSAADSLARLAATGGNAALSMALAGTNAFTQTASEVSAQGGTPAQAIIMGVANAGIEALSEKLPIDNLLDIAKGGVAPAAKIIKQVITEVGEEEASLLANLLVEAAFLRDKSSYNQAVNDLIMQGVKPEQAKTQVGWDLLKEAAQTAAVSAVSGGVSAASAAIAAPKTAQERVMDDVMEVVKPKQETAQETTQQTEEQARREQEMVDFVRPITEAVQDRPVMEKSENAYFTDEEESAWQQDRADSFDDSHVPPEPEVRFAGRRNDPVNPFLDRNWDDVGNRSVKAYMYENPEVKPFFQAEAYNMLMELGDTTRGEKGFNEDVHYESGGESGWYGIKRHTSKDIEYLLDTCGFTYDQIEKGLKAIIEDNGAENNAASKRIEFVLNDRLMNGHQDFYSNDRVPASEDYINLVNEKQITQYSKEAFDSLMENADQYVPPVKRARQADTQNQSAEGGQQERASHNPGITGTGAAESNFSAKPAYNATLSEDNAQPDRQDDVRPMELPQTDINGGRISAVTGNVYAARVTPDEFASLMEEPTARGDFSYMPISNNQATQAAQDTISRYGWEDAYHQWSAEVRQGRAGAEMSARGALFLNHAAQAGDREQWLNILSDFQRLGTNTAQGLQAFRILRTLAPSDRLYMIRRSVQQMVDDMHLRVPIQIDQQMADDYQNAPTNEEADIILDLIMDDVAAQIPSTIGDRWTALRYVNMLGNLRTQARNISGNIGSKAAYLVKDEIGAALEGVAHAINPDFQRTKSAWVDSDLKELGRADFEEIRDIVLDGGRFNDPRRMDSTRFAREVNERRQIFNNRFMEGYRRLTNWAMNNDYFGDAAFARSAYARAFGGYLKANGFSGNTLDGIDQNLLDNARLYAIQQAQESTFRDHNAVSDWVSRIGRRQDTPRAIRAVSEGVMPFRATPANVLIRAEEFSPMGLINTAVTAARAANPSSAVNGTDVVESLSKSLTGTGLFMLGALLGDFGMLTGGPDADEDKDEFDKVNGEQNYALQLPDGSNVTIDFLSPVAVPMFLGAEMGKIITEGGYDLADFEAVFLSLADPLIQMSMLQGLNDTLDDLKYSKNNLGQFFLNAAMSYLTQGITNTLLGQMERASESERMTTFVDKDSGVPQWLQRQIGKVSQKVPGWDYQQTPYINAKGETEKQDTGPMGWVYNLVSPGYISKMEVDDVAKELYRLNDAGASETNVFPTSPETQITYTDSNGENHKDYNLNQQETDTLKRVTGQTSMQILSQVIKSDNYNALTDAQKAKARDLIYEYSREKGRSEAVAGYPKPDGWMMGIDGKEADTIIRKVAGDSLTNALSDINNAWDEGWSAEKYRNGVETAYDSYSKFDAKSKAVIKKNISSDAAKYIEARENSVPHDSVMRVMEKVGTVKGTGNIGEDGERKVRDADVWAAIAKTGGISEDAKDTLMKCYMPDNDTTEDKYDYLRNEGYSARDYAELYDIYSYEKNKGGEGTADRIRARMKKETGISDAEAREIYKLFGGYFKPWEE